MGRPRLHSVDDEAFAVYSEDAAYWAGFLMADGTVTPGTATKQARIKVGLDIKDADHLVKFQQFLKAV